MTKDESPRAEGKEKSRPQHTVLPVFLATFGTFFLSILNAAFFAFFISIGLIYLGVVDLGDAKNLEEKMRVVGESKIISIAAGVLGTSSALLIVALGLSFRPRGRLVRRLRLYRPTAGKIIWVTIGMLGLTHALGASIFLLNLENTGSLAEFHLMFESWSSRKKLAMLPILALCPGVAEEVFFRGYALTKLELARGFGFAAIASALLFGLIHLDPIHSVAAALMGVYLAYAVRVTGSIWPTIIAHIVNNSLAVSFPNLIPEQTFAQVLCLVLGLAVSAVVLFIMVRRPEELPSAQW